MTRGSKVRRHWETLALSHARDAYRCLELDQIGREEV
jgi:hypothetical protein